MRLSKRHVLLIIGSVFLSIITDLALGETIRFEAEEGLRSGSLVSISADVAGYSGEGYVKGFRKVDPNTPETVTVVVYADSAGNYPLSIGYRSPYDDSDHLKHNRIWVNDVNDLVPFYWSEDFTVHSYDTISLNAGTNTIAFQGNGSGCEGWMELDYFEIDGLTPQAINPKPFHQSTVDPSIQQLCWTNPDPGPGDIMTCDVYFGTDEPDDVSSDYGLTKIASGMWGNCIDVPYLLDAFQTYYWIVDCWDYNSGSPILLRGGTWQFTTGMAATKIEAEDGWLSFVEVDDYVEGFSGNGYVAGFDKEVPYTTYQENVTISVYASKAGDYPLSMGFRSDYGTKEQYLFVNDIKLANAVFPQTNSAWDVLDYGNIALEKGVNTIKVSTYWGYIYLDYFLIQGLEPAAMNPLPHHLSTVGTNLAQLCWTNPNPGLGDSITCDVYWGEEPNELSPNYGLTQIAAGTPATCVDVPITLTQPHDYYWCVNCWDSEGGTPVLLKGGLWNFKTGNTPPDPNVGPDQSVWLGMNGTPGEVTVNIDAFATDDGLPSDTLTYEWAFTSDLNTVIGTSEDLSGTLTATGDYEVRLTVSDGEFEGFDEMTIYVRDDACEAAQANPLYWAYDGDLNGDCYVNLSDFQLLAMDWLKCVDPGGCL